MATLYTGGSLGEWHKPSNKRDYVLMLLAKQKAKQENKEEKKGK
jgi:hypothetical protein